MIYDAEGFGLIIGLGDVIGIKSHRSASIYFRNKIIISKKGHNNAVPGKWAYIVLKDTEAVIMQIMMMNIVETRFYSKTNFKIYAKFTVIDAATVHNDSCGFAKVVPEHRAVVGASRGYVYGTVRPDETWQLTFRWKDPPDHYLFNQVSYKFNDEKIVKSKNSSKQSSDDDRLSAIEQHSEGRDSVISDMSSLALSHCETDSNSDQTTVPRDNFPMLPTRQTEPMPVLPTPCFRIPEKQNDQSQLSNSPEELELTYDALKKQSNGRLTSSTLSTWGASSSLQYLRSRSPSSRCYRKNIELPPLQIENFNNFSNVGNRQNSQHNEKSSNRQWHSYDDYSNTQDTDIPTKSDNRGSNRIKCSSELFNNPEPDYSTTAESQYFSRSFIRPSFQRQFGQQVPQRHFRRTGDIH